MMTKLKEAVEKMVQSEFNLAKSLLDFLEAVKEIDDSMELEETEKNIINAACECIQTAAMVRKIQRGYEVDEK